MSGAVKFCRATVLSLGAIVAIGAGVWFFVLKGTTDPARQVADICAQVPTSDVARKAMVALGWHPLDIGRYDEAAKAKALQQIGLRRAYNDVFDLQAERAQFNTHHGKAVIKMTEPEILSFERADSTAIAVIGPIEGVSASYGCDVFLPDGSEFADFDHLFDPYMAPSYRNGFAASTQTAAQQERPGLWVADLVHITPDAELTAFLGATPPQTILASVSYRAPLPQ